MKIYFGLFVISISLMLKLSLQAEEITGSNKCEPIQQSKPISVSKPSPKIEGCQNDIKVYCCQNPSIPSFPLKDEEKDRTPEFNIPELLNAIAKILGTIAWPIAAIFILRHLRVEIAELLSRLRRGKFGKAVLEFDQRVREAEEEADIPRTEETESVDTNTVRNATRNPRGAILDAWLEVESALYQVVESNDIAEGYTKIKNRALTSIRLVQKRELLSSNYVGLFHDLRVMRNDAAHSIEFSPPADSVVKYVKLAEELTTALRKAIKKP